jgi:hypothetical protein
MHVVPCANRGAQTAVFELDIRISNQPYIDVCQSLASETGLKSRNVEKGVNAVWATLMGIMGASFGVGALLMGGG